jgi:ABC-type sugar transport system permease subunit
MNPSLDAKLDTLIWSAFTIIFILIGSIVLSTACSRLARSLRWSVREQRNLFWGIFFASPWILGFFIFVVGPSIASLYFSFTDYKLGESINFVGLANYQELLLGEGAHGGRFVQAMYNSFYYALVGVPLQIMTALIMALLLNQALKGISVFRLIFYVPVILAGGPAILLAWRYMLASNGGFINSTLQGLGDSFFVFDWLKRVFIFGVEGFNSFYAGIAKGDPIGPFKYAFPAILAVLVLWSLRKEWDEKKRGRALLVAEIVGGILALILCARALIAETVDMGLFVALAIVGLWWLWTRTQQRAFLAIMAVLGAVLVGHFVQLDISPTRLVVLPQLLTFQSTFPADNMDALKQYGESTFSTFWLYGGFVMLLVILAVLDNRAPRLQRNLIWAGLVFFGVIALSATLDGVRYFQAYANIAVATGKPNYHFALFNKSMANFPDSNRVPLWLSNELWSKPSLILITMWSSGAGMLIFLAALKGVPQALYEAAEVDGATPWQRFRSITLPMISPALFYNIVIGVIAAIQTFESVYIIQNTQTKDSLASAAFFLYERTFTQLAIGDGAAVSWVLAAVIILLTVFQFRFSKWVHYE